MANCKCKKVCSCQEDDNKPPVETPPQDTPKERDFFEKICDFGNDVLEVTTGKKL